MATKEEIIATYKAVHDDITNRYYKLKTLDKTTFEQFHSQCWQEMANELIAAGFKEIPQSPRDVITELNELKARLQVLEGA